MIAIYRRQTSYCLRTEALCFEGRVGVDIVFFERVLIQSWSLKKVFIAPQKCYNYKRGPILMDSIVNGQPCFRINSYSLRWFAVPYVLKTSQSNRASHSTMLTWGLLYRSVQAMAYCHGMRIIHKDPPPPSDRSWHSVTARRQKPTIQRSLQS